MGSDGQGASRSGQPPASTPAGVLSQARIFEAMLDAVLVAGNDARVVLANAAAERLFEVPREALLVPLTDYPVRFRLREPAGAPTVPVAHRALRGEVVPPVERLIRTPGGVEKTIRTSAAPLRDEQGAIVGAVVLAADLSAERSLQTAQEALRESEQRFRSVFERAAIGMGRVRFSDARWIDVNDTFCRMLGRSRGELLGTAWPEITHPDDLELDLAPFRRMAAGELETYTVEKRFIHARGHPVWAKLTLSLVRDAHGTPEYEVAVIEDITERKRAEEALRESAARLQATVTELREAKARLEEADRRKDEFLGMLSHELRNPLAPIRTALYILDHAEPAGQQAQRAKDIASRQLAHLTRLVDDLLDVTRIARGKIELRREDLDVAALARRSAEDYRPLMQDRHLELGVELPRAPVLVNGDPARLTQVLGNLLNNAAKFTPPGGRVVLRLESDGPNALVRVRDTGAGIEPDLLETVFEPFTQGKQTLARSEGGLGLGLALVKGLVALHGGEVRAHSAGQGRGTEFVVTLPLARPRATTAARPGTAPAAHGRGRHVLVIDDNHDAAETLAELATMFGHEVEVVHDAFEGLAKVSEEVPDVILCDIGLPGMDGYEFARQLRALAARYDVRLVALSGYAQPEDVARAIEAGFDVHVAKPPDPEQLARILEAPAHSPAAG